MGELDPPELSYDQLMVKRPAAVVHTSVRLLDVKNLDLLLELMAEARLAST